MRVSTHIFGQRRWIRNKRIGEVSLAIEMYRRAITRVARGNADGRDSWLPLMRSRACTLEFAYAVREHSAFALRIGFVNKNEILSHGCVERVPAILAGCGRLGQRARNDAYDLEGVV
jgi:hypothetical protein